MSQFDKVDLGTGQTMSRMRRVFLVQIAEAFQTYLDECQSPDNQPMEGMEHKITPNQAVELINDFLLYSNDGEEPPHKVKTS